MTGNDIVSDSDREFAIWLRRLLMMLVKAIETRYNIDNN